MIARALSILLLILAPTCARAEVIISEIAWMGTVENSYDEWIELYNSGSENASLEGWVIEDGGASPLVVLTNVLQPGSYTVLKTTYGDGEQDDVSEHAISYARLLSDSGKTLILKNAEGDEIDKVTGGTNWENVGGSKDVETNTVKTAQWTGSKWVTGTPTPGSANTTEEATENEEETQTHIENENGDQTETTKFTTSSGGGSSKKKAPVEQKVSNPELSLRIDAPTVAYVNQDVSFEMAPSGVGKTLGNSLIYTWNFGDTYTGSSQETEHAFAYAGEYIVVGNAAFAKQNAFARHEIKVLPLTFSLERTEAGDIIIKNNAKYEADIGGFTLRGAISFVFPKFTLMKAGGVMTIPQKRVGGAGVVSLHDAQGVRVAGDTPVPKVVRGAPQTTQALSVAQTAKQAVAGTSTLSEPAKDEVQETVIRIGNDTSDAGAVSGVRGFFRKLALFLGF